MGNHWRTFVTDGSVEDVRSVMGGGWGEPEDVGGYGHPRSIAHESGSRVYFGAKSAGQPVCVNMPGQACETWGAEGLEWCERLAGRTTRYDAALDLEPAELARRRLVESVRAWKRGQVETSLRRGSHMLIRSDKPEDGWTAYYGGKTSELQLRMYDRRGPLRIEFQIRPNKELKPIFTILERKWGPAGIWRSFAMRIRFPMPWYQQLLDGDVAELPAAVRREPPEIEQVIDHLNLQYGFKLWMMKVVGLDLNAELGQQPMKLDRDQRAKALRWAREADEAGYDGAALRKLVEGGE